jgi:DNA-binding FadR family transcriptional regulator
LNVGAFELIEARLMFEGEAAALAAAVMTGDELTELKAILGRMEAADPASAIEQAWVHLITAPNSSPMRRRALCPMFIAAFLVYIDAR